MKFKRTTIYLSKDIIEKMDEIKKEFGVPMSIQIRKALKNYILFMYQEEKSSSLVLGSSKDVK
jgi:metal-responsive CopG/Arc/MetJ family transcriptional regulator